MIFSATQLKNGKFSRALVSVVIALGTAVYVGFLLGSYAPPQDPYKIICDDGTEYEIRIDITPDYSP